MQAADLSYLPRTTLRCLIHNDRGLIEFYDERLADLEPTEPERRHILRKRSDAEQRIAERTAELKTLLTSTS